MSSVRMCDKCNRVFSENEQGWQTATLNTVEYDDDGRQVQVPLRQDLCSTCAVPSPRTKKKDETTARIEALEAENERLDNLTRQIESVGKAEAAPAAT